MELGAVVKAKKVTMEQRSVEGHVDDKEDKIIVFTKWKMVSIEAGMHGFMFLHAYLVLIMNVKSKVC